MNPATRLLALALATLCALLLALWALVQQAERGQQAELAAQRDAYLLLHLRTAAENYLATGLQLEQLQALQDMLEREQSAFDDIVSIDVFSPAGLVLYSTDIGSRGLPAPAQWRDLLAQATPWQAQAVGQRQIGQRFDNDLGQAGGGIVITLSTARQPATLAQWYQRSRLLLQWLALAALAALAAAAGLHLGLRRLNRRYDQASAILRGQPLPPDLPDPLAQAAASQYQAWQTGQQQWQHRSRQLEALDHEA